MKTVLTIAGSDPCGGAGIEADIKTITAHKLFALTTITALTAQNTTGIKDVLPIPERFIKKELDAVFSDIFPDAIKIGMLLSRRSVSVVSKALRENEGLNVVLDPVVLSTSGTNLLDKSAISFLASELFPKSKLITPNIPEAEIFSKIKICDEKDIYAAGKILSKNFGCAVLIKGGHLKDRCDDYLFVKDDIEIFPHKKISSKNNHGTGCTLSSAIACNLVLGNSISESVKKAKSYVTGALSSGINLGFGNGPLNHMYNLR